MWYKCGIYLGTAEFVKNPCFHSMHQLLSSLKNLKDIDRHLGTLPESSSFSIHWNEPCDHWVTLKMLTCTFGISTTLKTWAEHVLSWVYHRGVLEDCNLFMVLCLSGVVLYQLSSQFTSLIHLTWKQCFLQKAVLSFQNPQQFKIILEWNCSR